MKPDLVLLAGPNGVGKSTFTRSPPGKIVARYPRSLANLSLAVKFVNSAELFDNSDAHNPHRRIAHFEVGALKWKTSGVAPVWARMLLKV